MDLDKIARDIIRQLDQGAYTIPQHVGVNINGDSAMLEDALKSEGTEYVIDVAEGQMEVVVRPDEETLAARADETDPYDRSTLIDLTPAQMRALADALDRAGYEDQAAAVRRDTEQE